MHQGSGSSSTARSVATAVARRLIEAGHVAYFAGGCVRDRVMGHEPKDYDVATDARPKQVLALFPGAIAVGESFGVVLVRKSGHAVEVATFRTDGVYRDGRHPEDIEFSDAEHDARRRDFTVNGLFEDPETGEVIDYVNGRADIEARLIRAIGDPALRLAEDHLRMLRAIRFAARFQFTIEQATAETIRAVAGELGGVSRERIGQEVRWMMGDANRAVAAWEMQYLGVDAAVLTESSITAAPIRVGHLPDGAPVATALGAWILDRHGLRPATIDAAIERWSEALLLSNVEQRDLRACLAAYHRLRESWNCLGVAGQKRLASTHGFEEGLSLLCTESRQAFVDVRRRVEDLARTGLAPDPFITGEDLLATGLEAGPMFKTILDGVYDAQLEGTVTSRSEALALATVIRATAAPGGDPRE